MLRLLSLWTNVFLLHLENLSCYVFHFFPCSVVFFLLGLGFLFVCFGLLFAIPHSMCDTSSLISGPAIQIPCFRTVDSAPDCSFYVLRTLLFSRGLQMFCLYYYSVFFTYVLVYIIFKNQYSSSLILSSPMSIFLASRVNFF